MSKTVLNQDKVEKLMDCIISNLSRFSLKDALAEYNLTVADLMEFLNFADSALH